MIDCEIVEKLPPTLAPVTNCKLKEDLKRIYTSKKPRNEIAVILSPNSLLYFL
jgi:hypothetical protein